MADLVVLAGGIKEKLQRIAALQATAKSYERYLSDLQVSIANLQESLSESVAAMRAELNTIDQPPAPPVSSQRVVQIRDVSTDDVPF